MISKQNYNELPPLNSGIIRITLRKQLFTVSLKQAKLFEEHRDEFFACGVGKSCF